MTTRIIIGTLLLITGFTANAAIDPTDPVLKVEGKSKWVFKTNRELVGGTVALFSSGGQLLAIQKLKKRKFVIDFSTASFGAYKIVVTRDNMRQTFYYMKK